MALAPPSAVLYCFGRSLIYAERHGSRGGQIIAGPQRTALRQNISLIFDSIPLLPSGQRASRFAEGEPYWPCRARAAPWSLFRRWVLKFRSWKPAALLCSTAPGPRANPVYRAPFPFRADSAARDL